jgi:hypothetical protein
MPPQPIFRAWRDIDPQTDVVPWIGRDQQDGRTGQIGEQI